MMTTKLEVCYISWISTITFTYGAIIHLSSYRLLNKFFSLHYCAYLQPSKHTINQENLNSVLLRNSGLWISVHRKSKQYAWLHKDPSHCWLYGGLLSLYDACMWIRKEAASFARLQLCALETAWGAKHRLVFSPKCLLLVTLKTLGEDADCALYGPNEHSSIHVPPWDFLRVLIAL